MGGRRSRFSSQGSIRKKRKPSSSKQTLSRVAQRRADTDAKVRRRLSASNRIAFERAQGEAESAEKAFSIAFPEIDGSHEGTEERKFVEQCMGAYDALVSTLDTPLVNAEEAQEEDVEETGDFDEVKENVDEASEKTSLEDEHAVAVARERAHFDSGVVPGTPAGKMKTIGAFAGIGRVSMDSTEENREVFAQRLRGGLAEMNERALGLQPSLSRKWENMKRRIGQSEKIGPLERAFISAVREYYDILICNRLSAAEENQLRRLYIVHCLSHVLRCRNRVLRNDARLKENPTASDGIKDQGFSRARVLILAPMKNVAYEIVKSLIALAVASEDEKKNVSQVASSERFEAEFAPDPEEKPSDGANENEQEILRAIGKRTRKPADHKHTFRGNIDDDFKLGICFTKKTIRLYTDFYSSDIIIASPLGLRRGMAERTRGKTSRDRLAKKTKDEDTEWKTGIGSEPKKPKPDPNDDGFLSSIEICVVDGAHVFSMQNWDSLLKSVNMINKMPLNTRDTDFSRVRDWCLDGQMAKFRQTIVLSQYRKSEFMSMMRGFSNYAGRVDLIQLPTELGSMADVVVSMRQTFLKVPDMDSLSSAREKRLEYFFESTLPMLRALADSRCLLVIPSYFDYVRVRNKFLKLCEENATLKFASMCEYSKASDVTRARGRLYDGKVSFVLMTERFHFFWRHWVRGANIIVWYELPENGAFYPEVLNMTAEAAELGRAVQGVALYDRYDSHRLQDIVGQKRCKRMMGEGSSRYLFT